MCRDSVVFFCFCVSGVTLVLAVHKGHVRIHTCLHFLNDTETTGVFVVDEKHFVEGEMI